jgi:hypothetical protein
MPHELNECLFCCYIRSAGQGVVSCFVEECTGIHNTHPYYALRINVGGDKVKCEELMEIVHNYIHTVLGVPEVINHTGYKPPKPN